MEFKSDIELRDWLISKRNDNPATVRQDMSSKGITPQDVKRAMPLITTEYIRNDPELNKEYPDETGGNSDLADSSDWFLQQKLHLKGFDVDPNNTEEVSQFLFNRQVQNADQTEQALSDLWGGTQNIPQEYRNQIEQGRQTIATNAGAEDKSFNNNAMMAALAVLGGAGAQYMGAFGGQAASGAGDYAAGALSGAGGATGQGITGGLSNLGMDTSLGAGTNIGTGGGLNTVTGSGITGLGGPGASGAGLGFQLAPAAVNAFDIATGLSPLVTGGIPGAINAANLFNTANGLTNQSALDKFAPGPTTAPNVFNPNPLDTGGLPPPNNGGGPPGSPTPNNSGGPPGDGGGGPGGLNPNWGGLLSSILGAYGANEQTQAYKDIADRAWNAGEPSRGRFETSMTPGWDVSSIPGFSGALDASTNAYLKGISAKRGNPAGIGGAMGETMAYVTNNTALPWVNNYQNLNMNAGGLASLSSNAQRDAMNAIQSQGNVYGQIGSGISDLFGNTSNNSSWGSLAELAKMFPNMKFT